MYNKGDMMTIVFSESFLYNKFAVYAFIDYIDLIWIPRNKETHYQMLEEILQEGVMYCK